MLSIYRKTAYSANAKGVAAPLARSPFDGEGEVVPRIPYAAGTI